MSNLATITNNILADSGIDDINVIVSTGSYANPAWITSLAWTKITGAPSNIVTGTGTTNTIPRFTGASTIGDSSITDNTNEVSISKRLFLNTGGQSILFTPNLGGSSNRIETSALPLEITTTGSAIRLAAGGVTAQLTLASSGVVTLTNLAGTGTRIVTADASGNLSASSALSGYVQGSGAVGQVAYWSSGSAITGESNLFWDAANNRLGINNSGPSFALDVTGGNDTNSFRVYGAEASSGPSVRIHYGGAGGRAWNLISNGSANAGGAGRLQFWNTTDSFTALTIGYTSSDRSILYTPFTVNQSGSTANDNFYVNLGNPTGITTLFEHTGANGPVPFRIEKSGIPASVTTTYGILELTMRNNQIDSGANLYFELTNSANNYVEYAGLGGRIVSNTAGAESGDMYFYTMDAGSGRSTKLLLKSNGNFLIGTTTNAGFKLDVNGTGVFRNTLALQSSGVNAVQLSWSGSNNGLINLLNGGSLTTQILASGNSYFNGGNIGIGDTNPSVSKLSVQSTDSTQPTIRISNHPDGGNNFVFQRWAYIRNTDAYRLDLVQEVSSGLVQYRFDLTNNSTTYTSNLVLDRGNVGIGTSSPSTRLHVSYTSGTGFTLSNTVANLYAEMALVSANSGAYIFKSSSGYTAYGGANALNIFNEGQIAFHSNLVSNILYLAASGNVGIGTTSPGYKLHVRNSDTNEGTIAIGHDTFPGLIYSSASTGEFRIDNRSSAAAGYITFFPNGQQNTLGNEAMRIANSRNVLIGTTTDSGERLQVRNGMILSELASGSNGAIIKMGRSAGSYYWSLGIDGSSRYVLYNNSNTSMFEIDPNNANTTFGSGQNVTLRLGRNANDWGEVIYSGGSVTLSNGWASTSAYVQQAVNSQWTRLFGSGILDQNRTSEGTFYRLLTNGNVRMILGTDGSSNAVIRTGNSVDLRLGVNEDAITIKNGGNVLIGTTTDNGYKLNVNGSFYVNGNGLSTQAFYVDAGSRSTTQTIFEHTGATTPVPFRIMKSGYSGPGSNFGILEISMNDNTVDNGANLHFELKNSSNSFIEYAGLGGRIVQNTAGNERGDMYFYTTDTGATRSTKMLLKWNGNLLIGTTTDVGARLHVNGDIRTAAPSGGSAVNWKFGTARGGPVTSNATVRVEIDGVLVDLVARYV